MVQSKIQHSCGMSMVWELPYWKVSCTSQCDAEGWGGWASHNSSDSDKIHFTTPGYSDMTLLIMGNSDIELCKKSECGPWGMQRILTSNYDHNDPHGLLFLPSPIWSVTLTGGGWSWWSSELRYMLSVWSIARTCTGVMDLNGGHGWSGTFVNPFLNCFINQL